MDDIQAREFLVRLGIPHPTENEVAFVKAAYARGYADAYSNATRGMTNLWGA